jgi:uncharacterized LabA/DUF88 family protein
MSSDSDFTKLATRLRESGKLVLGIGEKKTPRPFIVACDKFIYIEILDKKEEEKTTTIATKPIRKAKVDKISIKFINLVKNSIEDLGDDDGWASLADLGALINKKRPDFDARNYGFTKLSKLIKSQNKHFEIDEREVKGTRIKHIYVSIK